MRILFILIVLLATSGCSNQSEKPMVTEDYGQQPDREASQANEMVAQDPPLKNTESFHTVEIRQMRFEPAELRLNKGDTVMWINKDITDHDVTEEAGKKWTSSVLPVGQSWSMVATESANYFCSIHVVMKGRLLVD